MKKIIHIFLFLFSIVSWGQQQNITYSVNPTAFEDNQSITLTFQGNTINESTWGVAGNALYLWAWSFDSNDTNSIDCPTNGSWTNSSETNRLTYNAGSDTYTITFTPNIFFNRSNIGRIGFLLKAKDGTGDKKSQDIFVEVGLFNLTLTSPAENSVTIITAGGNLNISANNSNGNADYILKANGVTINTSNSVSSYNYNHANITTNTSYVLEVTQASATKTKKFSVIVNPGTISQALPNSLVDGINYNLGDATKATLVLTAPGKDFVYVAGSFNNYQPTVAYAMKKDPTTGKFWLELTGLTSGQIEHYQYWVVDQTPIANSPSLVKVADPYSTLVLSPYDDPWTPASTYPNLPLYPAGQEREVTVLQTGQITYPWINTSFTKPKKEDLIVYEALIRDFDADRNYQDLIDKIDYFKNLKINAIELMPVMEFEGNESWGYNTSFHMALDKHYGPSNKLKEFVDLCHQNGIAVILDIAFNHAFGRNPMVRMWMNDPDADGWGDPSTENPYFNTVARHSYNVGSDFNHSSTYTKDYIKNVTKYWIQEYKIDGFRWDLTKGFTQNCTASDETCTNSYQADRVAILKEYVDQCWSIDPTHYAIFEHLGSENEEKEWANYRYNETPSKGVMMWSEMTNSYSELMKGNSGNIAGIGNKTRASFLGKRVMGYPESHDKDRIMYSGLTGGLNSGDAPIFNNLNNALKRMSTIGATSLLIPGPKMIWHFADLGMDDSIYTCTNGTVNTESDATAGDCKLATKPQPQWTENWLSDSNRNSIYNDWRKMITLKTQENVFEGDYQIVTDGISQKLRIYVYDDSRPLSELKDVLILANYTTTNTTIAPNFRRTGMWYNLMTGSSINVTNVSTPISIPAGGYIIYGNQPAQSLSALQFDLTETIALYPNPSSDYFNLSDSIKNVDVYTITGRLVKSFKGGFNAEHNFSVSDLSKGVYFVKLTDNNNKQGTIKFIKE